MQNSDKTLATNLIRSKNASSHFAAIKYRRVVRSCYIKEDLLTAVGNVGDTSLHFSRQFFFSFENEGKWWQQ